MRVSIGFNWKDGDRIRFAGWFIDDGGELSGNFDMEGRSYGRGRIRGRRKSVLGVPEPGDLVKVLDEETGEAVRLTVRNVRRCWIESDDDIELLYLCVCDVREPLDLGRELGE
jgi:hypothetical protein